MSKIEPSDSSRNESFSPIVSNHFCCKPRRQRRLWPGIMFCCCIKCVLLLLLVVIAFGIGLHRNWLVWVGDDVSDASVVKRRRHDNLRNATDINETDVTSREEENTSANLSMRLDAMGYSEDLNKTSNDTNMSNLVEGAINSFIQNLIVPHYKEKTLLIDSLRSIANKIRRPRYNQTKDDKTTENSMNVENRSKLSIATRSSIIQNLMANTSTTTLAVEMPNISNTYFSNTTSPKRKLQFASLWQNFSFNTSTSASEEETYPINSTHLSNTLTEMLRQNTPTEIPQQNTLTKIPRRNILSEMPRQNTLSEIPRQNTVSEIPRQNTLTEKPRQNTLTEKPRQNTLTENPRQNTLTEKPRQNTLTEIPQQNTLTEIPRQNTLTEIPEQNVTLLDLFSRSSDMAVSEYSTNVNKTFSLSRDIILSISKSAKTLKLTTKLIITKLFETIFHTLKTSRTIMPKFPSSSFNLTKTEQTVTGNQNVTAFPSGFISTSFFATPMSSNFTEYFTYSSTPSSPISESEEPFESTEFSPTSSIFSETTQSSISSTIISSSSTMTSSSSTMTTIATWSDISATTSPTITETSTTTPQSISPSSISSSTTSSIKMTPSEIHRPFISQSTFLSTGRLQTTSEPGFGVRFVWNQKNFSEAARYCHVRQMRFLATRTVEEEEYVINLAKKKINYFAKCNEAIMIGYRTVMSEEWRTQTGLPVMGGELSSIWYVDPETSKEKLRGECAALSYEQGYLLRSFPCKSVDHWACFVCESNKCSEHHDICYRFYSQRVQSVSEANHLCQVQFNGGRLAVISNRAYYDTVLQLFQRTNIGNLCPNIYVGNVYYSPYETIREERMPYASPNLDRSQVWSNEHCLAIKQLQGFKLVPVHCSSKMCFLCRIPGDNEPPEPDYPEHRPRYFFIE